MTLREAAAGAKQNGQNGAILYGGDGQEERKREGKRRRGREREWKMSVSEEHCSLKQTKLLPCKLEEH